MFQSVVLVSLLGICSWEDIKKREVTLSLICIYGIFGMLLHLFLDKIAIFDILGGMAIGIILLLIGKLFHQCVGYGDGFIILVSGIYLGMNKNIELLFYSVILSGIFSLILLCIFRKKKDYEIPFIPFVFLGYIGVLLL